jgi:hypothetical protein
MALPTGHIAGAIKARAADRVRSLLRTPTARLLNIDQRLGSRYGSTLTDAGFPRRWRAQDQYSADPSRHGFYALIGKAGATVTSGAAEK